MNYIQEINSFNDWLILNPSVSSDDISLWYALMNLNNISGWQQEFTVAISTIIDRTRLSRSAIYRSRNKLVQFGRISTRERPGNQSSVYQIIPFSVSRNGTQHGTQLGTQYGTQSGTQPGTINKLNKTKRKDNNANALFKPPDIGVVIDFFKEKNRTAAEAESFYDHYQSNGWYVGKAKMKDWPAAARNWIKRDLNNFSKNGTHQQNNSGTRLNGKSAGAARLAEDLGEQIRADIQ